MPGYKRSAFRADVEITGFGHSEGALKEMGLRARRTRPLMTKMVEVLQTQQARRINASPYIPLAVSTQARKISENEKPQTFRDEARRIKKKPTRVADAVYNAVVQKSYPGQVRIVTQASATFGLASSGHGPFFYLRLAEQGGGKKGKKGPKRRLLAISETNALALTEMVAKWVYLGWQVGSKSRRQVGNL